MLEETFHSNLSNELPPRPEKRKRRPPPPKNKKKNTKKRKHDPKTLQRLQSDTSRERNKDKKREKTRGKR